MNTDTLTERYVHEVVRRIPEDQRDDVATELRATIADTIEGSGEPDPVRAERAVITELGDPVRLAARYADRPLSLIGPTVYPAYIRLLVMLLVTVLPVVTVLTVALDILDHNDAGSAIGTGITTLLQVGVQIAFWVTVVFAIIDRAQHRAPIAGAFDRWTPDDLREVRQDTGGCMVAASVAWNALVLGLIVWQHTAEPVHGDGGDRLQVLDPDLWNGWIWLPLAGLGVLIAIEVVRILRRRWTIPLAGGYAVGELLFTVPMVMIVLDHRFFNPAFLAEVNGGWTPPDAVYSLAALVLVVIAVSDVVKRFREATRRG